MTEALAALVIILGGVFVAQGLVQIWLDDWLAQRGKLGRPSR